MLYNYNYFSIYYYIALLIVMKHGLKYIHNADSRFQIHALMLLNFFCTGVYSELMATSSIMLMDTIIA